MTNPLAPADLIVTGGAVRTLDDTFSRAEAVAVAGGKILAVGRDADIAALKGPETRVIEAGGATVLPGLVDGHAHMDREGLKATLPSLSGCTSIADIRARIRELAAHTPPGEWIVTMPIGEGPDYRGMPEGLAEGRWPTRHDLDEAAPDHPVYIRCIWGYWRHTLPLVSIANSAALRLAGIDRDTQDPAPTVKLERDGKGEPTGVITETTYMPLAEFTLMGAAPRFDLARRTEGLRRSMAVYNSFGTTTVYEGHGVADEVIAAYQALRAEGPLPVRSRLVLSPHWGGASAETVRALLADWLGWLRGRGLGDESLSVAGLFAEPGLDAENRLRAECGCGYTGWAGFHYDAGLEPEALGVLLAEAARAKIRVSGIGTGMLPLFAEADRVAGIGGARWVVEHISWVSPQEIAMARDLGVVMTTHTNRYVWKEGPMLLGRSPDRDPAELVPLRRLKEAGVPVCLATDNVPPSLFHPLSHAVRRTARDGSLVGPGEALTLDEALHSVTRNGAYLCFAEDRQGQLAPGYDADVIVLDRRLDDDASAAEISGTRAATTIVGGRVVHAAAAEPAA